MDAETLALSMKWAEPAGALIGFLLTLMVFSYLLGDNGLFRAACAIFIGVSSGLVTVLIVYNVFWQRLILPIIQVGIPTGNYSLVAILTIVLGIWFFLARGAPFGRPVVGYLAGVGAATAIGGALIGTIIPQVEAAGSLVAVDLLGGSVALLGTVTTLIYFNFRGRQIGEQSAQRAKWIEGIGWIGQIFVSITFGVLFAAALVAALTALAERLWALWQFIGVYILPLFPLQ